MPLRRPASGWQARLRHPRGVPELWASALLRQVLQNLIGNALKYSRTREESRIDVSSRSEGDQTVYTVRDSMPARAIGISGTLFLYLDKPLDAGLLIRTIRELL